MTWVGFRKHVYIPFLVLLCGGALAAVMWLFDSEARPTALATTAIVLFIPGAIARRLLRDLLAGRALMARRKYPEALEASRRFLRELKARPWIKHAIWTQFGIYTLSVEAMALNNAGAALIELKRFDEARGILERARDVDPAYALPAFNLGVIAKAKDDHEASDRYAQEAARLGFAGGQLDVTMNAFGTAYARLATPS